jgi:DNA-binding transcriptional regulator LsrR (DeoR family)
MSRLDEVRLMTKVARMYYVQSKRQQEITERLGIHQSTVSRLLKRARETSLVRISVATQTGIFPELEDALQTKFDLHEAVVVDCAAEEVVMVRDLGAATAFFLENTMKPGMILGISSWSRALFAMIDSLHPGDSARGGKVVQILGGVGNANTQYQATQLAQRLASLVGASPVLLQAPGIVGSAEARKVLSLDPAVKGAADLFDKVDLVLVGIGSLEPSRLLATSGNSFSREEREELRMQGAVGDICFRFFDKDGELLRSPLMNRVIGIEPASLKLARRVVGVAGGSRKLHAIFAALRGRWINVLITDKRTAEGLIQLEKTLPESSASAITNPKPAIKPKGSRSKARIA